MAYHNITILFSIALLIGMCSGQKFFSLYTESWKDGDSFTITDSVPDLLGHCPGIANNRSKQICVTGVWTVYTGANYTGNSSTFPKNFKKWSGEKCNNIKKTDILGSVLSIGPDASQLKGVYGALTIFSEAQFAGESVTYKGVTRLPDLPFIPKSLISAFPAASVNFNSAWIFYSQTAYGGTRRCESPGQDYQIEPELTRDIDLIQSVKSGRSCTMIKGKSNDKDEDDEK